MKEEEFFTQLVTHFRNNSIPIKRHRTYPKNNYAIIGNYTNLSNTHITLTFLPPIGEIDCFSVQFTQSKNSEKKAVQQFLLETLTGFLEKAYEKVPNGYIIYKKTANKEIPYSETSKDIFTKILNSNHTIVKYNDTFRSLISPGARIKNYVKYAYISHHPNTKTSLVLLGHLYNQGKELSRKYVVDTIRGCKTITWNSKDNLTMNILYHTINIHLEIIPQFPKLNLKFTIKDPAQKQLSFLDNEVELTEKLQLLDELTKTLEENKLALLFHSSTV